MEATEKKTRKSTDPTFAASEVQGSHPGRKMSPKRKSFNQRLPYVPLAFVSCMILFRLFSLLRCAVDFSAIISRTSSGFLSLTSMFQLFHYFSGRFRYPLIIELGGNPFGLKYFISDVSWLIVRAHSLSVDLSSRIILS